LDQNLFKVLEGILVLVQELVTDLDYQDLPMDEQYHYLYLYLYHYLHHHYLYHRYLYHYHYHYHLYLYLKNLLHPSYLPRDF
jgi:hypothetical protein